MKNLLFLLALIIGFLVILILRPVNTEMDNTIAENWTIEKVTSKGGPGDITLFVSGSEKEFYMNRARFAGIDVEELREQLLEHVATIHYADHFTPLDPFGMHRHVVKLEVAGHVLYDEHARAQ